MNRLSPLVVDFEGWPDPSHTVVRDTSISVPGVTHQTNRQRAATTLGRNRARLRRSSFTRRRGTPPARKYSTTQTQKSSTPATPRESTLQVDTLQKNTPPPQFDLDQAHRYVSTITDLETEILAFSHFGPRACDVEILSGYKHTLIEWVETVRRKRAALEMMRQCSSTSFRTVTRWVVRTYERGESRGGSTA